MARKGAAAQRGGGGRGTRRSASRASGAEKYGHDEADEVLRLHDDKVLSDDESDSDAYEAEEEDVMGLDEDELPAKQVARSKRTERTAAEDDEDDAEEGDDAAAVGRRAGASVTAGWRNHDFYGGDDAGDDSSAASDEELVLAEARKLEELRTARLQGQEDLLGALIAGPDDAVADKEEKPTAVSAAVGGLAAVAADAQFESLFAAEAEHGSVSRDLSQLSESEKRGLMRKEAPELVPLLEDFKAKLGGLQEMLPLLEPGVLKRFPASGVAYLEARISLILNTLANLSFYLLVRAEGGTVRAHPVVSQLVWLRDLHDRLSTLDAKLGPRLRKAMKAAKKAARADSLVETTTGDKADDCSALAEDAGNEASLPSRQRLTLRKRLEQLRRTLPLPNIDESAISVAKATAAPTPHDALRTKDLLKLPSRRRAKPGATAADAPLDLEEADPSLGFRRLGPSLGEQISSVQQLVRDREARQAVPSADRDVEARPRRFRERLTEEIGLDAGSNDNGKDSLDALEDQLMMKTRGAPTKKERKKAEQAEKDAAKAAQQFHPEEMADGRRKTSRKILNNRGLVRQRKEKAGNARVVNRKKYDKMVKRRRGAVQDMREGAHDGATYEGEATGVRTHVKKSLKLG